MMRERVLHVDCNTIFLSLQIYKDSSEEKLSSKTYCSTNGTALSPFPSPYPVEHAGSPKETNWFSTGRTSHSEIVWHASTVERKLKSTHHQQQNKIHTKTPQTKQTDTKPQLPPSPHLLGWVMKFLSFWDWIATTIMLFRQATSVQICQTSFSKTFILAISPALLNWSLWDKHGIFTWIHSFTTRAGTCCSASLNWYLQLRNLPLITLKVHHLIQEIEVSNSCPWMSTLGD